jgi:hypothetical protein
MHNYSIITALIIKLLKEANKDKHKKRNFIFTPKALALFKKLKKIFTNPLVVRHFNLEKQILLIIDVSKWDVGAIMLQLQDNSSLSRHQTD